VDQEFCKARVWSVLSREKEERKQILVHTRNQAPPDLLFNIRVTSPSEERWTQASAREDLVRRLEAELKNKILRYKMKIKDNLQLEWCWQAEPGGGGMECTILAHIRTGSSALSVQNKRHLHWKEIEIISTMNNNTRGAMAAHNLLLKKDPSSTNHLEYKHKMASILASPQAARKKRFIKLELGSAETSLPARTNPFQRLKTTGDTSQHNSKLDEGMIKNGETKTPPTLDTSPKMALGGGATQNPKPEQGHHKGLIGQQAALACATHV
jgi:hypothetical protein